MQELADRIWARSSFHEVVAGLQRAWISREIGLSLSVELSAEDAARAMRAAAVLSCSEHAKHRLAAFRAATSAYELFGSGQLPFEQALRVVLARLGNFPSIGTRAEVREAASYLPVSLLAEELAAADGLTIRVGDRPYVLTPFQHELWAELVAGHPVAIAAPTSAGKSFVLRNFLSQRLHEQGRRTVIYLVPTRALISQVSASVREDLERSLSGDSRQAEVVTVPIEGGLPLPARAVYVMTQERVQVMLSAHTDFAADVVVVDEAQGVGDGARGVKLHSVLDELRRRRANTQLLFASPGIANLDLFGRLFDLGEVRELRSREPTVAQNFLLVEITDGEVGSASLRLATSEGQTPIGTFECGSRTITRIEKLGNVSLALGRGATNIVYANGAADAEAVALHLAKSLATREVTPRRTELAKLAAESVHKDYALVECVKVGVAFHYSNMPTQLRLAIEQAVADGDVDYLACTSTLLQGVNLPARNIFMFRPEKGQGAPLESVDFWNLAGRAGRLLKEFQGNIFLIDYGSWRRKPLGQPRELPVTPAVDAGLTRQRGKLLEIINAAETAGPDDPDLEAVFVRLLGEERAGTLQHALTRVSRDQNLGDGALDGVSTALHLAARNVRLSQRVLAKSPDISAHKQQKLYEFLLDRAGKSEAAARALIPKHPNEPRSYETCAAALEACHRMILGYSPKRRLHRFRALIALWWMEGRPLPRIVQNQLNRSPEKDKRLVVRQTLELVERDIRYTCVRLLTCYNAVLEQVLMDLGMGRLASSIADLPLYLELGAASRTMISLQAAGLSRPTAARLAPSAPRQNMEVEEVVEWLRTNPAAVEALSLLAREEVAVARSGRRVLLR